MRRFKTGRSWAPARPPLSRPTAGRANIVKTEIRLMVNDTGVNLARTRCRRSIQTKLCRVGFSLKPHPVTRQSESLFHRPASAFPCLRIANVEHPRRPVAKKEPCLTNFSLDLHLIRAKLGKIQPQRK